MLLAPSPCLLLLCDGFCDVFSGLPPAMLNCSYSPPSGGKLKVRFSINATRCVDTAQRKAEADVKAALGIRLIYIIVR